jgi:class 3 adenylate cyclase/tetratricopeptide (TPR) repeat protein
VSVESVACASCGAPNPAGSRFCNSCGASLEAPATPVSETRKTVTILFIDATSSTALGERLDPESLRAVMTRYFDVMREVIEYHGGTVEKFIGDAVMAVFGVPTLHEDDALRACRAALEIHRRLEALDAEIRAQRGASVEWRMGINTGEVVAGDPGTGQRIVTGDAVNVAARLEAAAQPGQILLGEETYELVRGGVVVEPVEPLALKGKAEAVPAWRLTDAAEGTVRHAHERPMEAPLVGRQRPLRLLDEAFREAVEERVCHLFTIMGSAGVGKSRLVEEFLGSLGDQARVAVGRCLPYGRGITYWPVTEAIRNGLGVADDASAEDVSARLRQALEDEPEAERVIGVVGHLLGLSDTPPPAEEIFWGIRRTFEAIARQRPLVLVFDDIHWGESTFLDLVDHIAEWTRDAPILLVAKARPELLETRPGWGGGKRWVTTIQLEPLSAGESEELVEGLLGAAELPAELRTRIGQAAEGNPLFVEELLGKLIDDGFLVQAGDGWATRGDLNVLTIPATISALLAARLDGLGSEERTVIERASVEGQVFHRGAVTELAPEPIRPVVRDRLASLMRMELVRPDQASFAGDEAYRFRHLLIRDAAYQALAKQARADLHERFAAWLERVAADRVAEFEEIIGYHLEQAYRYLLELGPPDEHAHEIRLRAGTLLAEAGERADARMDAAATVNLLGRAVELLPEDLPRRRQLLIRLGDRCFLAGDGPRAERILSEVIADADRAGDVAAGAMAAAVLTVVRSSMRSEEMSGASAELDRLAAVMERAGDLSGARLAQAWAAFMLFGTGRAGEAYDRATALVRSSDESSNWRREAMMSRGAAMTFGPTPVEEAIAEIEIQRDELALWRSAWGPNLGMARMRALQGRLSEAQELAEASLSGFEELGNRHMVASAHAVLGEIAHLRGHPGEAAGLLREAYETLTAAGDRAYASTNAVELGRVLVDLGELDEAWRYGTIARDTSSTDDVVSQSGGRAVQARVLARRGQHEEAIALAREAVAIMAATDYLAEHGDVVMDLAHVLHEAGEVDEAIAAAREARELFARKGATLFVDQAQQLAESWSR